MTAPEPTPTEALIAALNSGTASMIVCYTKCWACQFGDHFDEPTPHTWMDDKDAEHAGVSYPLSDEDAAKHNCGCYCAKAAS